MHMFLLGHSFSANFYINEAAPMFRWCERVFETVDEEIEVFKQGLHEIMEYMTVPENTVKRSQLLDTLSQLLAKNDVSLFSL